MTTSADFGIPFLSTQQATPEVTHNEAIVMLQAMLNGVINMSTTAPPGSPTEGDAYIVGVGATGAWSGKDEKIAVYTSGGWRYIPGNDSNGTPIAIGSRHRGMRIWVRDDEGSDPGGALFVWNGTAWLEVPGTRIEGF